MQRQSCPLLYDLILATQRDFAEAWSQREYYYGAEIYSLFQLPGFDEVL